MPWIQSPVSGPNVQALAPSILSFDSSDSAMEVSKAVGPSKTEASRYRDASVRASPRPDGVATYLIPGKKIIRPSSGSGGYCGLHI